MFFFLSNINLTFLNSQWHSRLKKTLQEPRRKTNNHGHIHTVVTYGRICFFLSLDISTGSNQIGAFETNIFLLNSSSQSMTKHIYLCNGILNLDIKICPNRPKKSYKSKYIFHTTGKQNAIHENSYHTPSL